MASGDRVHEPSGPSSAATRPAQISPSHGQPGDWVLGLQRTVGNRATAAALRSPDLRVQRLGAGQPVGARGRVSGPLIGTSTFDKLRAALKKYEDRPPRVDPLPYVEIILGLSQHWLDKYGKSNDRASAKNRPAVEQIHARALRRKGLLQAQQIYLDEVKNNKLESLVMGGGYSDVETIFAGNEKVVGGGPEAQKIISQFKLTPAELTAIRTYSLGDFEYINPALANSPSWMKEKRGTQIAEKEKDKQPDSKAAPSHDLPPGDELKGQVGQDSADESGDGVQESPDQSKGQGGKESADESGEVGAEWAKKSMLRTFMEEGSLHGSMVMQAFEKLPPWRGVTWRGVRYTPDNAEKKLVAGKTLAYTAFGSTSKKKEVAQHFANGKGNSAPGESASAMMALTVRNGRDIEHLSAAGTGEREVLLPPGSVFTITHVEKHKSGAKGQPPADSWYTVYATQSDSAAKVTSPDGNGKKAKTQGGTALPDDAVGQVAVSKAFDMIDNSIKAEPKVTRDLQSIAATAGMKMKGLENKLKSEPSLARKLADRARTRAKTGDIESAVERVVATTYDTLRYTLIVPSASYAQAAQTLEQELASKGDYALVNNFNAWETSNEYKGINQGYVITLPGKNKQPPTSVAFEVQLHTDETFKTKTAIHGQYEEWRAAGTSADRRKELSDAMSAKWRKVKVPAGMNNSGAR